MQAHRGDSSKMREERNKISQIMNSVAQQKAILYCQIQKLQKHQKAVSQSGGWCEETEVGNRYGHYTDQRLIPALANFFAGKKVGSFGDGRGHYKDQLDKTKKLVLYDAYDGGPYYDKVSKGRVKYLDLTLPQYGLPLYDWVMSLEVAEHIPSQYEEMYLSNIVRHAKEGIVLSWAIPGQGGHQHVNLKPFGYVLKTMHRLGFGHDPEASKQLQMASVVDWLRRNINVYRRYRNSSVDYNDL